MNRRGPACCTGVHVGTRQGAPPDSCAIQSPLSYYELTQRTLIALSLKAIALSKHSASSSCMLGRQLLFRQMCNCQLRCELQTCFSSLLQCRFGYKLFLYQRQQITGPKMEISIPNFNRKSFLVFKACRLPLLYTAK